MLLWLVTPHTSCLHLQDCQIPPDKAKTWQVYRNEGSEIERWSLNAITESFTRGRKWTTGYTHGRERNVTTETEAGLE